MKHHITPSRASAAALAGVLVGGSFALVSPGNHGAFEQSRSPVQEVSQDVVASTTLLFVGDIMLDRHIRLKRQVLGTDFIFSEIAPLLVSARAVVGNLEGPITAMPSLSMGSRVGDPSNMSFTFPTDSADVLAQYGFKLVSVGNNHQWDRGQDGVLSTVAHLNKAGLLYVGNPATAEEPVYLEQDGIRFAFVSYNEFRGGDAARGLAAIATATHTADATIVLAHWGAEYEATPPPAVRELAHRMVDAGADLIIGTHSHVIGEQEIYAGTPIYYSLGNFIFDQYFSPEVRCGLVVHTTFSRTEAGVVIHPENLLVEMFPSGRTVPGCTQPGIVAPAPLAR